MSRVERVERENDDRQLLRRTQPRARRQDDPSVTHTPGKAEGEVTDVEEALRHQKE